MMMMKFTILSLFLLLLLPLTTSALDVFIDSFSCDEELEVRAVNFEMMCGDEGESRCTFGETVTLESQLEYIGVGDTDVQNAYVYMDADLKFFTVTYHLFEGAQINLCHNNVYLDQAERRRLDDQEQGDEEEEQGDEEEEEEEEQQDEEEEEEEAEEEEEEEEEEEGEEEEEEEDQDGEQYCPGDGLYSFSMSYTLPENNGNWLATGWKGKGIVKMYATQDDEDSLVGYCTLKLGTAMTQTESSSKFSMPSASTTFAIGAAAIAVLALCCCGFCFCIAKRRQRRRLAGKGGGEDAKTAHLTQHDYAADESDATSTINTRRDDGQAQLY